MINNLTEIVNFVKLNKIKISIKIQHLINIKHKMNNDKDIYIYSSHLDKSLLVPFVNLTEKIMNYLTLSIHLKMYYGIRLFILYYYYLKY